MKNLSKEMVLLIALILAVALLVFLKSALAAQEEGPLPQASSPLQEKQEQNPSLDQSGFLEGQQIPDFTIETDSGPLAREDLDGQPFVLEFISTTCPYCQASALAFQNVFSESSVRYIVLSALNEPMDIMKRWKSNYMSKTEGDVATNPGNLVQELGLRGTPTTLFVDAQGKIKIFYPGEISEEQIRDFLQEIS